MDCYACDQEATQRCARCGNSYCADHGDSSGEGQAQCDECLDPVNAAPSGVVFRVSLFALLGFSVLALWLLVRPPSLPGESSGAIRPLPTTPATATAGPTPAASPGASETPAPTGAETPAPTAVETPAPGPLRYVMKDGDTISDVAAEYGLNYLDLLAFNGLTEEEAALLQPGDEILIPQ